MTLKRTWEYKCVELYMTYLSLLVVYKLKRESILPFLSATSAPMSR